MVPTRALGLRFDSSGAYALYGATISRSSNRRGRLRPLSSIQFTPACTRPSIKPAIRSTSSAEAFRRWLLTRFRKTVDLIGNRRLSRIMHDFRPRGTPFDVYGCGISKHRVFVYLPMPGNGRRLTACTIPPNRMPAAFPVKLATMSAQSFSSSARFKQLPILRAGWVRVPFQPVRGWPPKPFEARLSSSRELHPKSCLAC